MLIKRASRKATFGNAFGHGEKWPTTLRASFDPRVYKTDQHRAALINAMQDESGRERVCSKTTGKDYAKRHCCRGVSRQWRVRRTELKHGIPGQAADRTGC